MDKFTLEFGFNDYPFRLLYATPNSIIIEEEDLDYAVHKSLTNNIEEVIQYIIEHYKVIDTKNRTWNWFQLGDDGLFKLIFKVRYEGTHAETGRGNWTVFGMQWKYIGKDLTAFNVLFGNKGDSYE
jgi:hypothetical protein